MLRRLFTRSQDEPVSNLRTASRWMEGLPTEDTAAALEAVVKNLAQANRETSWSKDRLEVLMHLDTTAREMLDTLIRQYLRSPRMSRIIESRLWTLIHAFYWEVTRGYHAFLMDFAVRPGGRQVQSMAALTTLRALKGFADIFKWRSVRHERPDPRLWLKTHNLYRLAEFERFQNQTIRGYPGESPQTVGQAYLQALLLSVLPTDSWGAGRINMVASWLNGWSGLFVLESTFHQDRHVFMVDTALGQGLVRTSRAGTRHDSCRYLATNQALGRLQEIQHALRRGAIPAQLGLGEDFRIPADVGLLTTMTEAWSMSAHERRQSARLPARTDWIVVHGVEAVASGLDQVSASTEEVGLCQEEILDIKLYGFVTDKTRVLALRRRQGAKTLNAQPIPMRAPVYQWTAMDTSADGMGLVSPSRECEWTLLGQLVGLRPNGGATDSPMVLGVISRTSCMHDGQTSIGLRVLSRQAQLGRLVATSEPSAGGMYIVGEEPDTATTHRVVVMGQEETGVTLVLPPSLYVHQKLYAVELPGQTPRNIRMTQVMDRGAGWLAAMCTYTGGVS